MPSNLWLDSAYFITSIISTIDLLFSVYITYLILTHHVFHTNLRILMIGITLSSIMMFVAILCTVVTAIGNFNYQHVELRLFHLPPPFDRYFLLFLWGGFAFTFHTIVLFLERIYASFHLRAYEHQTYCVSMISCDIAIFAGTYGLATCIVNLWISMVVSAAIMLGTILAFVTLYACLFRAHLWNKHRFFRSKIHVRTYTLSQRFQLSENVRTVSLILNTALYASVGGGMTAIQTVMLLVLSTRLPSILPILNVTQPLILSLIFLPAAISQVLVIPAWKLRTVQLLNTFSRCRGGAGKVTDTVVNSNGEMVQVYVIKRKINEGRVQEQELYFEMFKSAWQ